MMFGRRERCLSMEASFIVLDVVETFMQHEMSSLHTGVIDAGGNESLFAEACAFSGISQITLE